MMEEIEKTRESIWISTYVFKYDEVTQKIIDALITKRSEGIDVKLLIDSVGSWKLYFNRKPLEKLLESGAEIRFFMPIFRMPFHNYINLRNHRKIYLFDQKSLLTGGMNLAQEYMGSEEKAERWEDMLLLAKGPAVFHHAEVFAADWKFATAGEELQLKPLSEGKGKAYMQVVPSGPDIYGDALYEAIISAIYSVKKRLWIVTPYFVPGSSLMQAMRIAHHKGVDVKLITPRVSNHLIADLARSSYMRELEEAGIELALYEGKMLHAKAILFDDIGAMLGSVNIDNRSLLLNYEIVSFSYSEEIIDDTEKWMRRLLENSSSHMRPAGKVRRLGENLMRIFAPQL